VTEARAQESADRDVEPLRVRRRAELGRQIVHDSIHRRAGWLSTYALALGGARVGWGGIAVGGPWRDEPTVLEFYVLPEHHGRAFELFEALLAASGASGIEVQSDDALATLMLHTFARNVRTEKILFAGGPATDLPAHGSVLRRISSDEDVRRAIDRREGTVECVLELDGAAVASGGIGFHYNRPYGDVYYEVAEPFRRRGLGAYLAQELARLARDLESSPCARCSPSNVASRKTLVAAGFVPTANLLAGALDAR